VYHDVLSYLITTRYETLDGDFTVEVVGKVRAYITIAVCNLLFLELLNVDRSVPA